MLNQNTRHHGYSIPLCKLWLLAPLSNNKKSIVYECSACGAPWRDERDRKYMEHLRVLLGSFCTIIEEEKKYEQGNDKGKAPVLAFEFEEKPQ